jgi:hypothetical protein
MIKFLLGLVTGFFLWPLLMPWIFKLFPQIFGWFFPHYFKYLNWVTDMVNRLYE